MSAKRACEPVIIIGMHRSGTGMLTQLLEKLGLFVGKRKSEDQEAPFFFRINNWIMNESGGSWENPKPIIHLLENEEIRQFTVAYMQHMLHTPHVVSFLGWRNYIRHHSPSNLAMPWGWKDPCNTFTLPLWLQIFPNAKVIQICRHGVDVANSLKKRAEMTLAVARAIYERRKLLLWLPRPTFWLQLKGYHFTTGLRSSSLQNGFSLWEEYMQEARAAMNQLGDQALTVKYEALQSNPGDVLGVLSEFTGLNATSKTIANLVGLVKKERLYAHRRDPKLRLFAEKVAGRLSVYGY